MLPFHSGYLHGCCVFAQEHMMRRIDRGDPTQQMYFQGFSGQ